MSYLVRAATGITISDIPSEYKYYPIIGKGNTSLILEKNKDTVIVLTRDAMKKDWLHFGLKISPNFTVHKPTARKNFSELSIFGIEMPKLQKLSPKNKKIVNEEIKFWNKAREELSYKKQAQDYVDYYYQHDMEDSMIGKVLQFLQDYEENQWEYDLAARQFLEDTKGNIYLVDPIVSKELHDVMFSKKF